MISTCSTALTARQADILAFMVRSMREHGRPPSIREVVAEFRMRSPNGAQCHLQALVKKGKLRPAEGLARGYVPITEAGCCPACGRKLDDGEMTEPLGIKRRF